MNTTTLASDGDSILIRIPMKMKKRGGRKEIVVPCGLDVDAPQRPDYQGEFVIALARAHRWQELLESGRYPSIREMADAFGVCSTYMSRLMRFTTLAPSIIVAILDGNEPDYLSQNKLVRSIPALWDKQDELFGQPDGVDGIYAACLPQADRHCQTAVEYSLTAQAKCHGMVEMRPWDEMMTEATAATGERPRHNAERR